MPYSAAATGTELEAAAEPLASCSHGPTYERSLRAPSYTHVHPLRTSGTSMPTRRPSTPLVSPSTTSVEKATSTSGQDSRFPLANTRSTVFGTLLGAILGDVVEEVVTPSTSISSYTSSFNGTNTSTPDQTSKIMFRDVVTPASSITSYNTPPCTTKPSMPERRASQPERSKQPTPSFPLQMRAASKDSSASSLLSSWSILSAKEKHRQERATFEVAIARVWANSPKALSGYVVLDLLSPVQLPVDLVKDHKIADKSTQLAE